MRRTPARVNTGAILVTAALLLSACSSGDDETADTASGTSAPAPSSAAESSAAAATDGASPAAAAATDSASPAAAAAASGADIAAAKEFTSPYIGKPSKFPVDTPLTTRPTGKRIAYMDCGTPICGLFYTLSEPAAKSLGMELTRVKTGLAADTVASAFSTVVEQKFDGVFVPAISPALWKAGADALKANKVPIVTSGVTGADPASIDVAQVSDTATTLTARLLAAYVVSQHSEDTDVVFYITPELPFTNVMDKAFNAEVAALCPKCKSRTAKIPAATLGNSSASLVTSDLEAHPDTKVAVFAVGEQTGGLQAALKTAGIKVEMIANSPDPATLKQIQDGQIAAGLGLDLPVVAWTVMDSLARLTTGQPAAAGAKADIPPLQFLTKDDLKGDVSHGWTAYPDFADRFAKLWTPAA